VQSEAKIVILGLGEVGRPLYNLISKHHDVLAVDIAQAAAPERVEVMHVCYPFQIKDFIGETERYIRYFRPRLTIINSTVAVGVTRAIAQRTGARVVNSPVRGKHVRMEEDLHLYTKFIGALDPEDGRKAACHYESAGFKTKLLSSPEATELAKLTETSYFGVMIAWAQEVERYCDQAGVNYDEVISFYREINFFPPVQYFPGIIGGHCVMPNIELLRNFQPSAMLDAIQASNRMKIEREAGRAASESEKDTSALKSEKVPA
jgi:UDP-N-acetyl-D-mannosaminuronate dehydrogenase